MAGAAAVEAADQVTRVIEAAREQVRAAGDAAHAVYRARTQLVNGFRAEATVRQFSFAFDEPSAAGGTDTAPAPTEYVLAALGACQELVYAMYARFLGVPIETLSIAVRGDLDPRGVYGVADVPAGFQTVSFDVRITSPAGTEAVTRLIETVNRHCPVLDILQRPLSVTGTYTVNEVPLDVS